MSGPAGHRKFYDFSCGAGGGAEAGGGARPEELVKYVAENIIGGDAVFSSPFGPRKVVYCDYIASGRSLAFLEDYIRAEVLPHYGSTHTTATVTALQTTLFRHEARDILRNAVQASEHDRVVFVGSGATAALHKLVHCLALDAPPVVLVGPYAHHSSLLPWRELGAKVIRIRETAAGGLDTRHLEETLAQHRGGSGQVIGCFAAASNVTGVLVDDVTVTRLLHRYGALAFWDYATAAPYVPVRMNPTVPGDALGHAHKDAVFFSMHKFLGGVQTPGVLVAKAGLFRRRDPEVCGGGAVFFVSRDAHRYLQDVETREEGGTPAIVEAVRAGLVMQLTATLTPAFITTRNARLARVLEDLAGSVEELEALGNLSSPGRLPILSFVARHPPSGLLLHHNFVSSVLNDLYGIQARGGCACAGPYAQDLLGLPEPLAQRYEALLLEDPRLDRSHLRRRGEHSDLEVLRPGFVRLNLSYTASSEQIDFIVSAVAEVCRHAWKLLPQYTLNPETGEWKHHTNLVFRGRQWLGDISYRGGTFTYPSKTPPSGPLDPPPDYSLCIEKAREVFSQAAKASQRRQLPDDTILFQGEAAALRWFLLPSEAKTLLSGGLRGHSSSKIYPRPPFTPARYPLSVDELKSRPDYVWEAKEENWTMRRPKGRIEKAESTERGQGMNGEKAESTERGQGRDGEKAESTERGRGMDGKKAESTERGRGMDGEKENGNRTKIKATINNSVSKEETDIGENRTNEEVNLHHIDIEEKGKNSSPDEVRAQENSYVCPPADRHKQDPHSNRNREEQEVNGHPEDKNAEETEVDKEGKDDEDEKDEGKEQNIHPTELENKNKGGTRADNERKEENIHLVEPEDKNKGETEAEDEGKEEEDDENEGKEQNIHLTEPQITLSDLAVMNGEVCEGSNQSCESQDEVVCEGSSQSCEGQGVVCEGLQCLVRRGGGDTAGLEDGTETVDKKAETGRGTAKWHSPPKNIFNPTVEALTEFDMIRDGDRVMVCLSGGKDSLSLLHVLRQYQFYSRARQVTFTLAAATVDPMSAAYDPRPLIPYLASLGVPYFFEQQDILGQAAAQPNLNSICSFCSRMKRGRLYAAARRNSCNVLAFGQHLDDLAESFMMSVFHNGRLRTMKAHYTVKEGDLRVIRPFVYVREKDLRNFAESRKLPVIPENCPACFESPKERQRVKQVLAGQEVLFPGLYWSLRSALHPVMAVSRTGVESRVFGKGGALAAAVKGETLPQLAVEDEEDT